MFGLTHDSQVLPIRRPVSPLHVLKYFARRSSGRPASLTPNSSSTTAATPGITATQKTARKSFDHASINPTASSGPRNAPTVSSDCRSPNAAPRD